MAIPRDCYLEENKMPKTDTAVQTDQKTALVTTAPRVQTLTPAEQMEMLFQKLGGNHAFGICRGHFDGFDPRVMLGYDYRSQSGFTPTEALRHFTNWFATRKVMLNLLATLLRDGHTYAYGELLRALTIKGNILEGETTPVEQTTQVTILIPDADRVLLLARWLFVTRLSEAAKYINGQENELVMPVRELTDKVLETFPEMREHILDQSKLSHPFSPTAIFEETVRKIHRVIEDAQRAAKPGELCSYKFLTIPRDDTATLWYAGFSIGFIMIGFDVEEIRRKFNRADQGKIGIWKFNVPTIALPKLHSYCDAHIGFYPESEQTTWHRRWPSFASNNFSQNHGAALFLENDYREDGAFGDSFKPIHWSRLTDQSNVAEHRFTLQTLNED
jgi:hypothetical protein